MAIQFMDLSAQQALIEGELEKRIRAVLAHNNYILGPEVAEFEKALEAYTGASHCLGCSSGTSALDLALMALGVGEGDAVLTTPFTFVATAESIAKIGAIPVFVDIDPRTFNLDVSKLDNALQAMEKDDPDLYPLPQQAKSRHLKAVAILAVDIFGRPAPYQGILELSQKYGLKTIEDAAQGFGAFYLGRPLCNCGCDVATTSFFPTKPLGCYGDGGAVFTNDDALAELMDSLRYHGRASREQKYENVRLGMNGRLDTFQAAILLAKLTVFSEEIKARQVVAQRYDILMRAKALDKMGVLLPLMDFDDGTSSVWAQYTIQLPGHVDRKKIIDDLKANGIPAAVHYPKGLHEQKAFAYLGYKPDDFPATQAVCKRVLSLPMHPYLGKEDQQKIVDHLENALARQQS